jgi:hypothetical protein
MNGYSQAFNGLYGPKPIKGKNKMSELIALLEEVSQDASHVVFNDSRSSAYPIGRLCHAAAAELRRLHVENEALRADAERYRWLRDPKNAYHDAWNYFSHNIDAAIDAARSEK